MSSPSTNSAARTFLVECFGAPLSGVPDDGRFLAALAVADDEQVLVLVRGGDAAAAERRCASAGLIVDRVVEVALSPAWRWSEGVVPRRRARATPR